ncbi:hypothetical protein QFZ34_001257 [Phyllobacterium ifriqiyense]|uniref:Uncharacterized protein n=1 Tax=Phyllobacterium ifriqiyense TaxID=314238 RepID=A0ABU0S5Q2_9HYPH|nr:hypothetical protein [Phyllobacterium ifriqiyense]MDQ0996080.1 hypothetical protein [Phyllobacterium ifriqiyense]
MNSIMSHQNAVQVSEKLQPNASKSQRFLQLSNNKKVAKMSHSAVSQGLLNKRRSFWVDLLSPPQLSPVSNCYTHERRDVGWN